MIRITDKQLNSIFASTRESVYMAIAMLSLGFGGSNLLLLFILPAALWRSIAILVTLPAFVISTPLWLRLRRRRLQILKTIDVK